MITKEVEALDKLKKFAVQEGFSIQSRLLSEIDSVKRTCPGELAKVDRLTIELTQITYPVTVTNVDSVMNERVTGFVWLVLAFGLIAAVGSGYFVWVIQNQEKNLPWILPFSVPAFSILLGIVGAVVYVMLPNGRLNAVLGLDRRNKAETITRLGLGGLLGYVVYIAGIATSATQNGSPKVNWTFIIPLLGGYSITLVVGFLYKLVAAAKLAFNIDEKSTQASLRE